MENVPTTFEKQRLSITKHFAIFLAVLFVACLLGTGFLVYYLSPCNYVTRTIIETVEICNHTPVEDSSSHALIEVVDTTTQYATPIINKPNLPVPIDVRLPTSISPDSYNIKLIPFILEQNFTFRGEVKILINVLQSTNNITLHAEDLTIDESSISISEFITEENVSVEKTKNDTERQFLIILLNSTLEAGKQYNVFIKYVGILNDILQGFYRSSYKINNETRWIVSTQFQPTDARKAFPCFDEPDLKAKFTISIARPSNMSSISNMPHLWSEPVGGLDNYVWDHYQQSVPMSTYLVAFVVSDFAHLSNGNFTVWARADAIEQARYSLEVGPQILKFFENYFQIQFPLPKLDMIALPDFAAGAMENWGLITFRESAMLYEEGVSSTSNLQRITSVVAHELAHQWFGNLVTPKWWTDLWLNEGFASYMEYIATDAVKPEWKVLDQFVVYELQNVLSLDGLKSSHQISIVVNNPAEINDIFDRISYAKGATIIGMMEHFLTSTVFRKGLTNYLNSRRYNSAEQNDLWLALTDEAHRENVLSPNITIKQIMDTWTLQTGFPVVSVIRSYDESNSVVFEQERFLLENNANESKSALWWIPVTYRGEKNNNATIVWMPPESRLTLNNLQVQPSDWLLANVDQSGYYRVNYDIKNWQLLTKQLLDKKGFSKFSVANRAQMIDDSLSLAAAGYLDYEVALNVSKYLINERECIPWMSAFTALDYLQEMFIKSADYDKFKVYMTRLIDGLYRDIGFEDSYKDSQLTIYNRMNLLWRACLLGNLDCIKNAVTHFHNWKSSPNPDHNNPISPNLKNVVYCVAIRVGGQDEWEFAWQRYLNTNVGSEKDILLSALGCTRETWLLSRYLHWAVTEGSGIRKQDSPRVFNAVASNVNGQELAYRFLKNNLKTLKQYMGSSLMLLNTVIKACTSKFCTQEELNDLKSFVASNTEELSAVTRTLDQSIEQTEANVGWMNRNYKKIVGWLSNFQNSIQ